ncbi:MAG: beta-N-acetylhexosaminidase [Spirochaetales bacterium]|nr:beta-N-acetylhexosaminidase [Spirochaetales bacterium]
MKKAYLIFIIFCLLFISAGNPPGFWDKKSDSELINDLINAMTDEELLGQVFFIGYQGTSPPQSLFTWIGQRNLGGVKIFTRNVSSLSSLAGDIKRMQLLAQKNRFKIPLFIATDQEGGWVSHIRKGFSSTGGNLSLGAAGIPHDAFLTGYYIGSELKTLGINMNFAPNLDIYSNPDTWVIGPRAFSSDPRKVGLLGLAYLKGQEKAGIIATAKHFPGHGRTDLDSHGYLPKIDVSFSELWEKDLLPYRFVIKEGIHAIMSAHLAFPQITGNTEPATLSHFFINEVLRKKLQFKGIVITDDLEMWGVRINGDNIPTVCQKALQAGNDMLLVSHTPDIQEQAWVKLIRLLKSDKKFKQRVQEAVRRILQVKLKAFKGENAFPIIPDEKKVPRDIPAKNARQFFFDSSCRSITIVRGAFIPYRPLPDEKILIVGQYHDFLEQGVKRYPEAATLYISWAPQYYAMDNDIKRVTQAAGSYDTVIFCLSSPSTLEILEALKNLKKKIIVISALTPVYLLHTPWIKSAIAVYGESTASFSAGFAVLAGDFSPEGKLPIDFLKP